MIRPTSNNQISEATHEIPPTLDHNTFYVRPSAAGTLQLGIDVRTVTDRDTCRTHGLTVYAPVDRGEVALLVSKDQGTAKTLDALCSEARKFTKAMTNNEGRQRESQERTIVHDYDTILRAKMAESKLKSEKRHGGSLYKVELLDGPEPSAAVFENQGFKTLVPKQIDDVNYGVSEIMARVVKNEQPPAGTSAGTSDRTSARKPARKPPRKPARPSARTAAPPSWPDTAGIFDDEDVRYVPPDDI